jgi:hypothetical protein
MKTSFDRRRVLLALAGSAIAPGLHAADSPNEAPGAPCAKAPTTA